MTVKSKTKTKKYDEIPGDIELHLSTFESTKNQFRFKSTLTFTQKSTFYEDGTLLCRNKLL